MIQTVSFWRRILASELNLISDASPIAELFNALFFIRAVEDDQRKSINRASDTLRDRARSHQPLTLRHLIQQTFVEISGKSTSVDLIDFDALNAFDALDQNTIIELLADMYKSRFAPYSYDFSLMSKHALSRIYEKYISVLRDPPDRESSLFPMHEPAIEISKKNTGEYYTPQYIARFFSRFLKENIVPSKFRSLKTIDPSCGSGIFLRTLLEAQCDPLSTRNLKLTVEEAFAGTSGIDVEKNACKAAKLSLSLLHLALVGEFPRHNVNINEANVLEHFNAHFEQYDVVIANPPFVSWPNLPLEWQAMLRVYLKDLGKGRPDLYLAFLKAAIDNLKPAGFFLFVLPHAFLLASNAERVRKLILKNFWIRYIVDLSGLNVFDDAASYPILLIAERKHNGADPPPVRLTKCSSFAGYALQAALGERNESGPFYAVYSVPQKIFESESWRILSRHDYVLQAKLRKCITVDKLFVVAQGLNTGCDQVFIRVASEVPPDESLAYAFAARQRNATIQPYRQYRKRRFLPNLEW